MGALRVIYGIVSLSLIGVAIVVCAVGGALVGSREP